MGEENKQILDMPDISEIKYDGDSTLEINEVEYIGKIIKNSSDFELENGDVVNLSSEVIWSAMHHLKHDPTASIKDALDFGYNEWFK